MRKGGNDTTNVAFVYDPIFLNCSSQGPTSFGSLAKLAATTPISPAPSRTRRRYASCSVFSNYYACSIRRLGSRAIYMFSPISVFYSCRFLCQKNSYLFCTPRMLRMLIIGVWLSIFIQFNLIATFDEWS